jgi:hypothetical protein
MKKKLWEHVKWMLEIADEDAEGKDLLLEPDASAENDDDMPEQSVCANVAGATTPLGTDATYPNKKKKSRAAKVGGSFGGGKVPNSK